MGSYSILIGLSLAVILSYIYNLASRATRVPAVLLLLLTGIGLRQWADYQGINFLVPKTLLEIFGIIGLIMIVLEGALDLRLTRDKVPLIRRSFLAAAAMLVAQAAAIGGLLHLWLGASWQTCLLNAVPLVVISSAIAIPSVTNLTRDKQEFIVYESTFSDILGIMLFNFVDQEDFAQGHSLLTFGRGVVLIVLVAIVSTVLLSFLLGRLREHVKFFLLFAFLILMYSLAKKLHLSSLLLVLAFGLAVNNADLLLGWLRLRTGWRGITVESLAPDLHQLKSITAESAFLIRTFFFLLFGYSITLANLISWQLLGQGLLIVAVLTALRYGYLRFVARTDLLPELFIAPKGLITVLLFYSIPAQHVLGDVSENILFVVILLTSLLMMVGLIASHQRQTAEIEF
ncbi:sodium:proton antiporter [Hymenobacter sp. HMF4947]|uniref:Sodium:proton antiporter n=1 Tax=Hymenobacter ginkgonis TaxID=2682976 RepID=A0A7K1TKW4_9BACT|nr:sodium:proton antiporter [Hymenobacter ginkgonis]MVN78741.1 sodium:proton antiporter [Hymenobacter ginkgonis]